MPASVVPILEHVGVAIDNHFGSSSAWAFDEEETHLVSRRAKLFHVRLETMSTKVTRRSGNVYTA
jgi:hypothetical protein